MTFTELRERLQAMPRKDAMAIADAAKVPQSTVDKLRMGIGKCPRVTTIEPLVAAFKAMQSKRKVKEAV
jgi:hypothetical protein